VKAGDANKAAKLARLECRWWQAHHRKEKKRLMDSMAELYALQYGLSLGVARRVVRYRVEAARLHDLAERLEDRGAKGAKKAWEAVEVQLQKHFLLLLQHQAS
jgi:hypothetical protein